MKRIYILQMHNPKVLNKVFSYNIIYEYNILINKILYNMK